MAKEKVKIEITELEDGFFRVKDDSGHFKERDRCEWGSFIIDDEVEGRRAFFESTGRSVEIVRK